VNNKLTLIRNNLLIMLFSIILFQSNGFASDFKLIGKFLLEYSIFKIDVYEISYFKASDGSEKLVLDYKRDVEKKYSIKGWEEGLKYKLKDRAYTEKAKWLLNNTIDLKEGDKFSVIKNKSKVTLQKNEIEIATIKDPLIAELAFEPWLGNVPVSMELKNSLLGVKKGE
jgi:hypothetical protein